MLIDKKYIVVDSSDFDEEKEQNAPKQHDDKPDDKPDDNCLGYLSRYNLNVHHAVKLALEKDPHTPFYWKLNELTQRIKDYVSLFYNTSSSDQKEEEPNKKTFIDELALGNRSRINQILKETEEK